MNRRIKKKRILKFSMLMLHKFNPYRRKMVPITKNDTIWTAYLRLKRIHHRQLEHLAAARDAEIAKYIRSESFYEMDIMKYYWLQGGLKNES